MFQRTQIRFLLPTRWLTNTYNSHLQASGIHLVHIHTCKHQAYTWYTYIHVSITLIYIKNNEGFLVYLVVGGGVQDLTM